MQESANRASGTHSRLAPRHVARTPLRRSGLVGLGADSLANVILFSTASGDVDVYIGGCVNGWDPAGMWMTRTYTVTYRVTDACRNLTEASATVTVPHNQGVEAD